MDVTLRKLVITILANPVKFEVKVDRLKYYLDKGAVMSDTVRNFVKKNRVLEQEG